MSAATHVSLIDGHRHLVGVHALLLTTCTVLVLEGLHRMASRDAHAHALLRHVTQLRRQPFAQALLLVNDETVTGRFQHAVLG